MIAATVFYARFAVRLFSKEDVWARIGRFATYFALSLDGVLLHSLFRGAVLDSQPNSVMPCSPPISPLITHGVVLLGTIALSNAAILGAHRFGLTSEAQEHVGVASMLMAGIILEVIVSLVVWMQHYSIT